MADVMELEACRSAPQLVRLATRSVAALLLEAREAVSSISTASAKWFLFSSLLWLAFINVLPGEALALLFRSDSDPLSAVRVSEGLTAGELLPLPLLLLRGGEGLLISSALKKEYTALLIVLVLCDIFLS